MKRSTIIETIVILFAILFLYTGISKMMEYSVFKEQIAASPILAPVSRLIAAGLPLTEFLVTILLIIPKWRLKGLYASLTLMSLFTIYILQILAFSKQLPCSCGGVLAEMSWTQHIVFNCLFIAMAIVAIKLEQKIKRENKEEWITLRETSEMRAENA